MGVISSSGGSSSSSGGGGSSLTLAKPIYQTVDITRTKSSSTKATEETVVYTATADTDKSLFTLVEFQNTTLQDAGNPVTDPNYYDTTTGDYYGPKGTAYSYPMTVSAKSPLLSYNGAPSASSSFLPTKENVYATGTVTTSGSYSTGVWSPSSNTTGASMRMVDHDGKVVPYMYNGSTWQQWSPAVLLYPGDVITVKDGMPADYDGYIDPSFALAGTGFNGAIRCMKIDSDGKILVGGDFTSYNGITRNYIARLNANGTLDTTFAQTGTGLNAYVSSIDIDGNGKILIAGMFTNYNSAARGYIARLNSNGTLDTTFTISGTGTNSYIYNVYASSSNKLIITGNFTSYAGVSRKGIARLNNDGTVDTAFVPPTAYSTFSFKGFDDNGKLVCTTYANPSSLVIRLNADGALDTILATVNSGAVLMSQLDSSKKMILCVQNGSNYALSRLNSDGTTDSSFTSTVTNLISTVAFNSSGQIIAISSSGGVYTLIRLNSDGSLDSRFSLRGSISSDSTILVDSSNKIMINQTFTPLAGSASNNIARIYDSIYTHYYGKKMAPFTLKITKVSSP